VSDLEGSFSPERVFVQRIRRGGEILEAVPDTVLRADDLVVLAARRHVLLGAGRALGPEVEDRDLLAFPLATLDVVLTRKDAADRTLDVIAEEHGRGVVLQALVRGGEPIPFGPGTLLNRGDLLRITGAEADVERAGKALGYSGAAVERDRRRVPRPRHPGGGDSWARSRSRSATVPLSLTASGGALIMGLVFGWLRSVRPTFGRIPEPALWVFDTVGLAVFIGVVGLGAGPSFVAGLRSTGASLLVVGFAVALIPHVAALLFGRYVLKMNPAHPPGRLRGAGTVTAALRAIQDEAGSKAPALGYTVPYAIGNILLTAWGPVVVMLTR
jgi:putative transport protein